MVESLATRYFSFSEYEKQELCKFSNIYSIEYYHTVKKFSEDIEGVFYEVKKIRGNWRFKDQVLPPLFREIYLLLEAAVEKIEGFEVCLSDLEVIFYNHRSYIELYREREQRIFLLKYLTKLFREKFLGREELSENYTHLRLRKEVARMAIRIKNIFTNFIDYTAQLSEIYAQEGIRNLVIERLNRITLPLVCEFDEVFDRIFYPREEALKEKLLSCFLPPYGNSEYHLAMSPIWRDLPGTGIVAYYFDMYPEDWETKQGIILITKDIDMEFREAVYYPRSRKMLEIFEELEKEDLFVKWFNNMKVRERIIYHITFDIFYKYYKNEIDAIKTTELLQKKLQMLEEYYGATFDFKEASEIAVNYNLKILEKSNYTEEFKTERKKMIEKIFPEDKVER